eukprot:Gb_28364 [translate_table: standard]
MFRKCNVFYVGGIRVLPMTLRLMITFTIFITSNFARPDEIRIGTVLNLGTNEGKQSKEAIDLAVEHVNNNISLLNGTRLRLQTSHIGSSTLGDAGDVVAPMTPQISNFVSFIADSVQVPLITFAANDPSISMKLSRYSIQMIGSDPVQMKAIASVLRKFLWREIVVVFQDDEFGMSGTMALNNALQDVSVSIVQKFPVSESLNNSAIQEFLTNLTTTLNKTIRSRVLLVHTSYDLAQKIFSEAKKADMVKGYIWIVTEWIASYLDSGNGSSILDSMQGIIGVRRRIGKDTQSFGMKNKLHMSDDSASGIADIVGLYAYDAVWMIARAIDALIRENKLDLDFNTSAGKYLRNLKVFRGGKYLYQKTLQSNFKGISGNVSIGSNGLLQIQSYEIVNVVNSDVRVAGSWNNVNGNESLNLTSQMIIWQNGSSQTPSGYRKLRVGVPRKVVFNEFINISSDNKSFTGFCIDVFNRSVMKLNYKLDYEFAPYGVGDTTADYNKLVDCVQNQKFDVIVADITILAKRMLMVDFTQPYTDTGLVIMVLNKKTKSSDNGWAFLKPFTATMWLTVSAFLVLTAFLVWLLEREKNKAFAGRRAKQMETSLWFSFSTIVFAHSKWTNASTLGEKVMTSLGQSILVIWLFVVLILNSSYTASLTSILTVEQLSPTIRDIETLRASNQKVGHLNGSFVKDYLMDELKFDRGRLVPLITPEDYAERLLNGSVGAIVDEIPYIRMVMGNNCGKFRTVGQTFYKGGFGFLFTKGSPVVPDMTAAVLTLTQNRTEIKKIKKNWFHLNSTSCADSIDREEIDEGNQLSPKSFWGLFLITASVYLFSIGAYFKSKLDEIREKRRVENAPTTPPETPVSHTQSLRIHSNLSSVCGSEILPCSIPTQN